jgi:hypothetical protein
MSGRTLRVSGENAIVGIPVIVVELPIVDVPLPIVGIPVHVDRTTSDSFVCAAICTTAHRILSGLNRIWDIKVPQQCTLTIKIFTNGLRTLRATVITRILAENRFKTSAPKP